ncbi:hypothetical protein PHYSODRAFT_297274 [Phytophthora sojae]|uniref:Uncharacterized protein n=1 Tax=Phytophthora sojae (strain P6497) TaxID=1094619 RepID=G4YY02_PHYSP|nr:hypothetical protein PHYSODRAFT_297274 [Phytophthora sojae]EGZ25705.1 hypothetical protein PHYSODRAFT_297274 [Phytophthora sojae]|eukprot:XP_009520993.1 hypothetical protein PHYSODRAFT_297274 [Phytophthora sojae]
MKQMELARQTQETFQDQYQNQVELHTKQNEMQEQLQEQYNTVSEQYRLLQEASVAMGVQNKKIEALEEKIGSRASSRWGWFAEKGGGQADVDMSGQGEMPPTPSAPVIATGANLPIPPLYRGTTTLDMRAFMDAYMVYERRVRALSSGTSARVYLMPLRLCIEQKTLVRICAYELCKAEEDVSDTEWKEYFLPARTTLRRDYSQLQADMKKLEMKATYQDAESRLVTLLSDFHAILD